MHVCVFPSLLCFHIFYYVYWSTRHWKNIKGQNQLYWTQAKQQTHKSIWTADTFYMQFVTFNYTKQNVHGVLRQTGSPSRVYSSFVPSIPRTGSRTGATLDFGQRFYGWFYVFTLPLARLQALLLLIKKLGNNLEKQDQRCFSDSSFQIDTFIQCYCHLLSWSFIATWFTVKSTIRLLGPVSLKCAVKYFHFPPLISQILKKGIPEEATKTSGDKCSWLDYVNMLT